MNYQILQGDNRETLKTIPDNSIDAIVTDPPYGIDFLGKDWDANTGALETYQECLRVLKPGGHILAFSAARTYHHLAITLEQAGFEIRDQIMWIYSSGFPKSHDVGRQIQKAIYGKPDKQRFDPDIMIKVKGDRYRHPENDKVYRKLPDINGDRLKKSHEGEGYGWVFEEVLDIKYDKIVDTTKNAGFGQTDHARVRAGEEWSTPATEVGVVSVIAPEAKKWAGWGTALKPAHEPICMARKPTKLSIAKNVQKWGTGALNIDATRVPVEGLDTRSGGSNGWDRVEFSEAEPNKYDGEGYTPNEQGRFPSNVIGEIPDYQKFYYCPKVSRKERHLGFDLTVTSQVSDDRDQLIATEDKKGNGLDRVCEICGTPQLKASLCRCPEKSWVRPIKSGNNHPTVKPIALMEYLIKLVTPAGGHVLDPFNGSGSTGCAAVGLGYDYTGIELDPKYVEIARTRIEAWYQQTQSGTTFEELFER